MASSSSTDEFPQCAGPEELLRGSLGPRTTHASPEHGKVKRCKAVGCSTDLLLLGRAYCLKKNICPDHLKADAIRCEGMGDELWRFCQQCGKLEPLSNFEGVKRSCRASLHRRRLHSSDKQQECTKRHHQHQLQLQQQQALVAGGSNSGWHVSCGAGCFNDDAVQAAAAALADAWCEYQQQQEVGWTEQQLSRSSSSFPGNIWSAGAADVYPADVARATADAGNVYSSSMPGSPAAAAALPRSGSSSFQGSRRSSTTTCSSDVDGCDDAVLDWILEMEGELVAAGLLATNSNTDTQQEHPWSCCGQAAVPALPRQQSCAFSAAAAAVNPAPPVPLEQLPTSTWCNVSAAVPPLMWPPVDVAASQQVPNSFAAPTVPTPTGMVHHLASMAPGMAPSMAPGQYGTGFFSGAAAAFVPGAVGSLSPAMLQAPGPQGVDKFTVISSKLQGLTARFGQLQLFMDHLKQLRKDAAALRAQMAGAAAAAAAAEAAACSYACAGW